MRLSLSVNGTSRYVASLPGAGFLSAHLNLNDRPKENSTSSRVRVAGHGTAETETTSMDWPTIDLSVGDIVELTVLPDGAGDPPVATRRTSESPSSLLSKTELAKELIAIVSDFEGRLMKLLPKAEQAEPESEYQKFRHAVGGVLYELGNYLLYPIYRRHKELIPDELKGELL